MKTSFRLRHTYKGVYFHGYYPVSRDTVDFSSAEAADVRRKELQVPSAWEVVRYELQEVVTVLKPVQTTTWVPA